MNNPAPQKQATPFKQIVLTLLYVSLGLVALASIGLIMFGVDSDYGGSAMGTVGLILLTDITILAALVARHDWLKYSSWATSFAGFVFVGISIWIPTKMYDYDDEYLVYTDPNTEIKEILGDIGWAFYLITFSLLVVGILSLLYKKAMATGKFGKIAYWTALGAFPIGTLPAAICLALQIESNSYFPLQWRFYLSMLILSATAFVILLIAIISQAVSKRPHINPAVPHPAGVQQVPYPQMNQQPQQWENQYPPHQGNQPQPPMNPQQGNPFYPQSPPMGQTPPQPSQNPHIEDNNQQAPPNPQ